MVWTGAETGKRPFRISGEVFGIQVSLGSVPGEPGLIGDKGRAAGMTWQAMIEPSQQEDGFSHEAVFYAGDDDFVDRAGAFINEGLEGDEAVLVVVVAPKIEWLRAHLGDDAGRVIFADMAAVGKNPARIIPLWREFFEEKLSLGLKVRGIGEPIWSTRTPEELVESQRHESLINLAFTEVAGRLMCPYDTKSLPDHVLDEALRSHPVVLEPEGLRPSPRYLGLEVIPGPFARPLPARPSDYLETSLHVATLDSIRELVRDKAIAWGLHRDRAGDLVLAVNEVITNSLRHAGGLNALRMWIEKGSVICEVEDEGKIDHPLVGRERPTRGQEGGFGLWLTNQLCDLVQIRSFEMSSVVRLHMSIY